MANEPLGWQRRLGRLSRPPGKRYMWYEAYGWKENPFSIKPSPSLVGLDQLQQTILEQVISGSPAMVLGHTGTGKTSLLLWLFDELKEKGMRPVYVNLHRLPPPQAPSLHQEILHHRTFLERLFRKFPKRVILLLDEAQELNQDTAHLLKAYYDSDRLISFVLASCEEPQLSPSLRSRIGPNLHRLGKLPLVQAVTLVKHRTKGQHPFANDEVIGELVRRADGLPRKLLQLCEYICINLRAKAEIGEPITLADLQELLKPTPLPSLPPQPVQPAEPTKPSRPHKPAKPESLLSKLSPLQRDIVRLLLSGPKTVAEVNSQLGSTPDSIRKRLSQLRNPEKDIPPVVEIVSDRIPKRYGLTDWARKALKASS